MNKRMKKKYFTLPEVTIAIAILGIGLLSILGVFPVAAKSGLQAVKLSESIHKARAVSSIWQNFALPQSPMVGGNTLNTYIKADAYDFGFQNDASHPDNLVGVNMTAYTVDYTPSDDLIIPSILNGEYQLDRVTVNIDTDFVTKFYVITPKR